MTATTPEPDAPPTGAEVRAMTAATDRLIERFVSREDFERHRRNVRAALGVALLAVVLLVAAVVVLVIAVVRLGDVTSSNREVIDSVNECITPAPPEDLPEDPHECYERGEDRIAEALASVGESFNGAADRIIARIDELDTEG